MNANYNIGQKIKEYRCAAGLSQEELAFRAEISAVYLRRIEKNVTNPTIATVLKICRALTIQISDLFEDTPHPSLSETEQQILIYLSDKSDAEKSVVLDLIKTAYKLKSRK